MGRVVMFSNSRGMQTAEATENSVSLDQLIGSSVLLGHATPLNVGTCLAVSNTKQVDVNGLADGDWSGQPRVSQIRPTNLAIHCVQFLSIQGMIVDRFSYLRLTLG